MIVSVIIPCRNEVKNIAHCVEAVYASKLPDDYQLEVLIIDGKSDDGTLGIIEALKQRFVNLRCLNNPQQITPTAFNIGILAARGDFIQIIGARQILAPDYIARGTARLNKNSEIWCVGGKVQNIFKNNMGRIIAGAMDTGFGVGGTNFRVQKLSGFVDTVGTPIFPKNIFNNIGLFDEKLIRNQDDDFSFRIIKGGGKIYLDVEMHLFYEVRGNLKNLFKQYLQYGYWKIYVNRKHGMITTVRQLIPPIFILFLVIGWLPGLFLLNLFFAYCLVVLIYVLASFMFAFKKAENFLEVLKYVSVFLTLHFGYGIGYLHGIIHFLIFRADSATQNKTILTRCLL